MKVMVIHHHGSMFLVSFLPSFASPSLFLNTCCIGSMMLLPLTPSLLPRLQSLQSLSMWACFGDQLVRAEEHVLTQLCDTICQLPNLRSFGEISLLVGFLSFSPSSLSLSSWRNSISPSPALLMMKPSVRL